MSGLDRSESRSACVRWIGGSLFAERAPPVHADRKEQSHAVP